MSAIPCEKDRALKKQIKEFAEVLQVQAHKLGTHGLTEQEFYESGIFRGAIEQIRGESAATMRDKRDFVKRIFNFMQDQNFIEEWEPSGSANRHDYSVKMPSGKVAVVELKGCLDGNNTTIFERPSNANEFIIWSLCTNKGSDPEKNAWSGIHTRLGAEIISKSVHVDGLLIWDMMCGTPARPCPKLTADPSRAAIVGPHKLPPPCIYLFPSTVPSPRNNPRPVPQPLADVQILKAFYDCFGCQPNEVNYVEFEVHNQGSDMVRSTRVRRSDQVQRTSKPMAIRRAG